MINDEDPIWSQARYPLSSKVSMSARYQETKKSMKILGLGSQSA